MNTSGELTDLIKTGANRELEEALKAQPDLVHRKTPDGISLVQFAAYCRNQAAVDLLYPLRTSPDIFEAACVGDTLRVEQWLEREAHLINAFSSDGFTALGLATFFGHYDLVKFLLNKGADPNQAANNTFKVAPIHSACAISDYDMTDLLLKNGADVNAKQMQGVTALHSAAHNGQTRLIRLLIESGADVNAETDNGKTPLDMALEANFTEAAREIRKHSMR